MESIFPFFVVCILPLIWTALVFMLGRWSARHVIRIERRGPQPGPAQQAAPNAAYNEYYTEEYQHAR